MKGAQVPEPVSNGGVVSYSLGDSFNLRLLIHYIGDIHQPLHATSRFTAKYPDGDRGGNSFKLTTEDDVSCLHALWDSALHLYSQDLAQPLSTTDWSFLGTESARLTKSYPITQFPEINAKYTTWDNEALAIAESFVYEGITENTLPSDEYLMAGVLIAEQQIVKAGYRIALTLESMWGTSAEEQPIEEEPIAEDSLFLQ